MNDVLIFGDSFCRYRSEESDWPLVLAKKLNLRLIGFGLDGQSWWYIRKKLLSIQSSIDFSKVELVVACHTEPNRIIGSETTIQRTEENKHITKTYLSYLENISFNDWACTQWFHELNCIFKDKKVIHIQNFNSTDKYFCYLNGIRLNQPTLADISLVDAGTDTYHESLVMRPARNHLSQLGNQKLGEFLAKIFLENQISWPNRDIRITLDDI